MTEIPHELLSNTWNECLVIDEGVSAANGSSYFNKHTAVELIIQARDERNKAEKWAALLARENIQLKKDLALMEQVAAGNPRLSVAQEQIKKLTSQVMDLERQLLQEKINHR